MSVEKNNLNLNQGQETKNNLGQLIWLTLVSVIIFCGVCGSLFGLSTFEKQLFNNLAVYNNNQNTQKANIIPNKKSTFDLVKERFLSPLKIIFSFIILCAAIYLIILKITKKSTKKEPLFDASDLKNLNLQRDTETKSFLNTGDGQKYLLQKAMELDLYAFNYFNCALKLWSKSKVDPKKEQQLLGIFFPDQIGQYQQFKQIAESNKDGVNPNDIMFLKENYKIIRFVATNFKQIRSLLINNDHSNPNEEKLSSIDEENSEEDDKRLNNSTNNGDERGKE